MPVRPLDLNLERLRRLPPGDDVWQVAVRPGPQWVVPDGYDELDDDDESADDPEALRPYRPLVAICVSLATGLLGADDLALPDAPHVALALRAVTVLGSTRGIDLRPAAVEVTDPAIEAALGPVLADLGVAVRRVAHVPAIDRVLAEMRHAFGGDTHALYKPDVSIPELRAFAEAAVAFEAAAPWNYLTNDDLVHVETLGASTSMRWLAVMGSAGMRRGLGFFNSRSEFVEVMELPVATERYLNEPHWSVTFDEPYTLAISDYDRWLEHDLPRGAGGRIPVLAQMSIRGPGASADGPRLEFATSLLRMLATTTEDEMDEGRWNRASSGPGGGGERTLTLALPELLEAASPKRRGKRPLLAPGELPDRRLVEREMAKIGRLMHGRSWKSKAEFDAFLGAQIGKRLPDVPPTDSREGAQEIFYTALEAHGRRRIKLAREALRRDPDCVDALVLLAEHMPDPARARALYQDAVEAGERSIGPTAFTEHRGHFWGILSTRPYMRARYGLAERLWEADEHDAAIEHWRAMLELNPGDNQGVRYVVIPRLLERGRAAEAASALATHGDEDTAMMNYPAALAAFQLHGASVESTRRLDAAIRSNSHVVKYLLDPDGLPDELPSSYGSGSEEEAILAADGLVEAWHATPGAVEWLRGRRREAKKLREVRRKKRGR